MPSTILITGGQGFVGRALVHRFADLGHRVICADLNTTPFKAGVAYRKVDLRDAEAVTAICAGVDSVIHNASLVHTRKSRVQDIWDVNLGGTRNLLDACKANGVKRFVYISSASAVYNGVDIRNGDETLPYSSLSQAPYADSKIAAERLVLATAERGDIRGCALRPHVVFGPGDTRFLPALIDHVHRGRMKAEVGDRSKRSDFTYIDNLSDAVVAAEQALQADARSNGQAYFITNGEPIAFFEFVDRMLIALGYPPIRYRVPYWLAYAAAATAEALDTLRGGTLNAENGLSRFSVRYMATDHYYSIDKAKRELQWQPRISVNEGIRLTAAAFQSAANATGRQGAERR